MCADVAWRSDGKYSNNYLQQTHLALLRWRDKALRLGVGWVCSGGHSQRTHRKLGLPGSGAGVGGARSCLEAPALQSAASVTALWPACVRMAVSGTARTPVLMSCPRVIPRKLRGTSGGSWLIKWSPLSMASFTCFHGEFEKLSLMFQIIRAHF